MANWMSASHTTARWLRVAGMTLFQPSEAMKYILLIYMADALSRKRELLPSFVHGYLPLLIILIFSCGFIVIEPDLGTAVVVFCIVITMFFLAKVRIHFLLLIVIEYFGADIGTVNISRIEKNAKPAINPASG